MDVYLNISSEYKDKHVKKNIEVINESLGNHGLFQSEIPSSVEAHLKEINVLLQSVKTRNQGLQLLLPLIRQGSQELIEKRSELWFGACIQTITSLCGANEKICACQIITLLLKAAPNIPELQKTLTSKSSGSLIQSLATADPSWSSAALDCLYKFIKLFPGPALSQKVVIEENMLKWLDYPLVKVGQDDIVQKAGQVFAALPLPGMGGNKAQGRAEARGRQLTQLISLTHVMMDILFEGIVEKESYQHTRECTLKVPPIRFQGKTSADAVRGYLAAVTRLGNLLKFLAELLTSDSNESIAVVPFHVLGPIFRLMQVDGSVLKSYKSQEHQLLAFLISSLHQHCLLLLRDMIKSIGEAIDLYYGVIGDLLLSVIKMSSDNKESLWCANGVQTRIIAYSVLATVIQSSGGRHAPSSELVNLMLQDIMPRSQNVTLQKIQGKGLSSLTVQKKKKKKGYSVVQNETSSQAGPLYQLELLSRTTRVALALAETLYVYASHSLSHKDKKILQTSIMSITSSIASGASLPEAYTDGRTRAQLYKTLGSIATHPDPRCPPPYTMILYLLQHGQQDQQLLVVTTCQALIANVSFILANPQISEMAAVYQQLQLCNTEDKEEEITQNEPIEVVHNPTPKQHSDEDDEEDEESVEEEEKMEEDISHQTEASPESVEKDRRESELDKEETDGIDQVALENGKSSDEDSDDSDEDKSIPEEKSVSNRKMEKHVDFTKMNGNKSKSAERIDNVTNPSVKRKSAAENTVTSNKTQKKSDDKSNDGPTLEEMLGAFVDADPDEQ